MLPRESGQELCGPSRKYIYIGRLTRKALFGLRNAFEVQDMM